LFFPLILFYVLIAFSHRLTRSKNNRRILSSSWIALVFLQAISLAHWSFGKENILTKNTPFVSEFVKGNWGYFHFYHREHLGQLQACAKEIQQIIPKSDTILCLSDSSPNIQLYTLDRVGYTHFSLHESSTQETEQIKQIIRKGANFAVVIHEANWEPNKYWEPFLTKHVFQKGNVYVFDLRHFN
jgi:hypothetical protein